VEANLQTIDYAIIGTYMVFALGVGFVLSRKASESSENYFLGGRNMPWWLIGISMIATSYASDTPLAITEMVREHGLQRIWWFLSGCLVLITGTFLFARLWRRAEITTDVEFYELRYSGRSAAFLRGFQAVWKGVVRNFVTMAFVTLAMTSIITTLTDVNRWVAITVCISVALVYATSSGFYGVVVTDFVQFFIAIGGMVYLAVVAWTRVGGFDVISERITQMPGYGEQTLKILPDFGHFNLDMLALVIFVTLLWWNDAGDYTMQRISSCKNEKHSILATLFFAVFQTSRVWIWAGVALVSIVLFPDLTGAPMGDTQAYPMVMNMYLAPGMKGVLVTAFLAAYMSTIDTHLNWGASYIMTDIYRRFVKKEASEKHYMRVTRIVVVLLMLGAAALVPLLTSVTAAWEFLALLSAGSGLIVFFRWFWWRINAFTEIAALSAGALTAAINLTITALAPDWELFGMPWATMRFEIKLAMFTGVVIPVSLLVTYLTPPVDPERLESFYRRVRPGGFWGAVSKEARALPGKALGVRTLADFVGGVMLTFGISLGIGYTLLQRYAVGAGCFLAAVAGGIWVYYWFMKEAAELRRYVALKGDS
jgi:solute:Na+ symporter, SSS family